MLRRSFLSACAAGVAGSKLKYFMVAVDDRRRAGEISGVEAHFPTAAHQFVWRNWDLIPAARIAEALEANDQQVRALASTMGLGEQHITEAYASRLRFKVLRRNWDFVPYSQLEILLRIGRSEMDAFVGQDAFYASHLGVKPLCPAVRVEGRGPAGTLPHFRFNLPSAGDEEPPFAFIRRLSSPASAREPSQPALSFSPRISFPYFAQFSDVLSAGDFESYYPSGILARMAETGVNAIWVEARLRDLVPSQIFPEFGSDGASRLRRLNWLIARAKESGQGVYLYLNEPRAMRDSFFLRHPDVKGAPGRSGDGLHSLCTSTRPVQQWLVEATAALFRNAPGLSGVLLITASENPTNCYSLTRHTACPRCARRRGAEVLGEVVSFIEEGIRSVKPEADVVAWDWSWGIVEDDPQQHIIAELPSTVTLMVDFERGMSIERDGVRSTVDEYSLSTSGPSPRAAAHIQQARGRGMRVMAKLQVGNTWELGLLPYIPVPHLVARKLAQIRVAGISGAMESWTLGGYPSLNWLVARSYYSGMPNPDSAVRSIAEEVYGRDAGQLALRAWEKFAQAFEQYPFSNSVVYSSVVQCGPAHPWWLLPSGNEPRILNNYDDLAWTAPYGPERLARIFASMAAQWQSGLSDLEEAVRQLPSAKRREALRDLNISRAVMLYFRSISNHVTFHSHRDDVDRLPALLRDEIGLAGEFLAICRADARVGFESSLQYFYLPLDIREKIAACRWMLSRLEPS